MLSQARMFCCAPCWKPISVWPNAFSVLPDTSDIVIAEMDVAAPKVAKTVIEARGLGVTFEADGQPTVALSGVNLAVREGEFVSLIGPSGCGKTTLLRLIADLEQANSGTLTVNGMTPEEARKQRA